MKTISKGTIAICGNGEKGLITEDHVIPVISNGKKVYVWKGYHLGPSKIGRPWYSLKPRYLQQTTEQQYNTMISMITKFNVRRESSNQGSK